MRTLFVVTLLVVLVLVCIFNPRFYPEPFQATPSTPSTPSTSSTPLAPSEESQAAPPPTREDIVPETHLSDTGTAAMALGKQSSFLRDVRQMIQNEIRSDRALDPLLR